MLVSTLAKVLHLAAILHFSYALYTWNTFSEQENAFRKFDYGGKWVYLTFLNVITQAVYFTLALINDFAGSNNATTGDRPFIRKIRDYVFGAIAFPLALDVGGLFWLLYAIDRELVFPKGLDAFFPWWLNHFIHTNIMTFIVLEMILLHHKYPCRKSALIGVGIYMFAYLFWVNYVYYAANVWVYPVLAVFNWPKRVGFYVFTCSIPIILYYFGEFLNGLIWYKGRIGEESTGKKSKAKAKKQK